MRKAPSTRIFLSVIGSQILASFVALDTGLICLKVTM